MRTWQAQPVLVRATRAVTATVTLILGPVLVLILGSRRPLRSERRRRLGGWSRSHDWQDLTYSPEDSDAEDSD